MEIHIQETCMKPCTEMFVVVCEVRGGFKVPETGQYVKQLKIWVWKDTKCSD